MTIHDICHKKGSLLSSLCYGMIGIAGILPVLVAVLVRHNQQRREVVNINRQALSALEQARSLKAPAATAKTYGEWESMEFWQMHDGLLKQAWKEWAMLQSIGSSQKTFPSLDEATLIDPSLFQAIHSAWSDPSVETEQVLKEQFVKEWIPDRVYQIPTLFTTEGIARLRHHMDKILQPDDVGIPYRRPNGMNRYGFVLDPTQETMGGISYPELDSFVEWFVDFYVRPLGRLAFPEYISHQNPNDQSTYAFVIQYQPTQDIHLIEHADASTITLNININLPEEKFQGSSLYFVDNVNSKNKNKNANPEQLQQEEQQHAINMTPGQAVLHLGWYRHAAAPITAGRRTNLVIWLFGHHDYVRVAPYPPHEQMISPKQRWSHHVTNHYTVTTNENVNRTL